MHLDIGCFIFGHEFVDCPTFSWIHVWIEWFPCLILLPNVFELVLSKGEGNISLADSVVEVAINAHVVIANIFFINNRLMIKFGWLLVLVLVLRHLVIKSSHFEWHPNVIPNTFLQWINNAVNMHSHLLLFDYCCSLSKSCFILSFWDYALVLDEICQPNHHFNS